MTLSNMNVAGSLFLVGSVADIAEKGTSDRSSYRFVCSMGLIDGVDADTCLFADGVDADVCLFAC